MLRFEDVRCTYGAVEAVHGVSLQVPPRSILALLGPNGAGKTSLLMAVMGHVAVPQGRILLDGKDLLRHRATERVRLGVAIVPEGRQLFSDLTVEENLRVGGYARPRAKEAINRERVFATFPRLAERRHQISSSLSGGEQQMLAIGRALMTEPRLLLVDELSLGLMPKMVDLCLEALLRLKGEGLTIVLVEQNTARALDVADSVCVLSSGLSVFAGSAREAQTAGALFSSFLSGTPKPIDP